MSYLDEAAVYVVEAVNDTPPHDRSGWEQIRAFDRNWWVPSSYFTPMGHCMNVLCKRLETDGVLKPDIYRLWSTGHPSDMLRRARPTLTGDEIHALMMSGVLPVAGRSGAWTYYIPQDVERFFPPPKLCKVCKAPENEWQEFIQRGHRGYSNTVCSEKCYKQKTKKGRG